MSFRILGTGSCVPQKIVTNEDLSAFVDTDDEWIAQRVGVRERRVCTTETTTDLAYEAAVKALENSGTKPEELDLILCATISGDDATPALACMVQNRLGVSCPAMDINSACSGFIFLLETAAGFFARSKVKKMLIIGAERMSRILDWKDRSTCVIFGDGAGAAVLGEGNHYLSSKLVTRGRDDVIRVPSSNGMSPFCEREEPHPFVYMNGQETYKFAVHAICDDLKDVIREAGLTEEEIDYVVPHQANLRIIDAAKKRLKIAPEKYFVNIQKYGNTSAASIPLALDELNREGGLEEGDLIALCAFGGGLSSGACVLRW